MSVSIQIVLSKKLFLRDPEQTELGRRIVDSSIKLIDELGFEKFTFKKLANAIGSTEASIYRYFENKHKMLIYLVSWYWSWLEYLIDYQTHNIESARRQLEITIRVLANSSTYDPNFSHIDEVALHRIVVAESSKAFLTKNVDGENEEGLFQGYKSLANKLADLIRELDSGYPNPRALSVVVIETSRNQMFFSKHLPSLTEIKLDGNDKSPLVDFLRKLMFSVLDCKGE
ncbi:MAG TPA: TetR/AcrR family transcriptional regulator [Bacteroidetes bacterium]|nr:TetR/AcrR family transcriptional regulator [Bacteroidota bacterium]